MTIEIHFNSIERGVKRVYNVESFRETYRNLNEIQVKMEFSDEIPTFNDVRYVLAIPTTEEGE